MVFGLFAQQPIASHPNEKAHQVQYCEHFRNLAGICANGPHLLEQKGGSSQQYLGEIAKEPSS